MNLIKVNNILYLKQINHTAGKNHMELIAKNLFAEK